MCVLFVRNSSRLSPGAAPGVSVAMRSFALPRETSGAANEEKEKPAFTSNFTVFSERERCCPGRGPEGRAGRGERCPGGRSTNGTLRRLAPGRRGQGDRRALQAGKGPGHRSPGDALPSTTPPRPQLRSHRHGRFRRRPPAPGAPPRARTCLQERPPTGRAGPAPSRRAPAYRPARRGGSAPGPAGGSSPGRTGQGRAGPGGGRAVRWLPLAARGCC